MNRKTIGGIFAVLSILVLLIPISASQYVSEQAVNNVMAVQGTYTNGETIKIYDGSLNITEIMDTQGTYTTNPIGWDANNDTAFAGYESGLLGDTGVYYGNYITYIGNGTYSMAVDWDDVGVGKYDAVRYLIVPLNISCNELSEYDFGRINTNIEISGSVDYTIGYQSNTDILIFDTQSIDNDTGLFVIDSNRKTILDEETSTYVYLIFSADETDFDETQDSFTFNIEVFELESGDYLFGSGITDFTIWVIMVMGIDVMYIFVALFSTDLDIIWNKEQYAKWRK